MFPENIGENLAIDKTSLSKGELYTIVTNRDRHGGEDCLVAIVSGTKSEDVTRALKTISEQEREKVQKVTLDLSNSMRRIIRSSFPKERSVIDRFHIQKLACDAVQEANDMENAKLEGHEHVPFRYENGDTKKELLARSRYLLFKSADKWTKSQVRRAKILFAEYPVLQQAYSLSHSLRMIFAKNAVKDAARLSLVRWYNKVEEAGFYSFNVIAATFYKHYDDTLNFYSRASNASAESFNAKVKAFRAALRGISGEKYFLFRLSMIYAYPPHIHTYTNFLLCPKDSIRLNLARWYNDVERSGIDSIHTVMDTVQLHQRLCRTTQL